LKTFLKKGFQTFQKILYLGKAQFEVWFFNICSVADIEIK